MDNQNPVLLSETKGLDNQLRDNLCGPNGREWLEAYKSFMKKMPTWAHSKEAVNPYLRLISGGETVTISACKGGKKASLAHAQKTFAGGIYFSFTDCEINLPQPKTHKVEVDIHEMYNKKASFQTLFGSLSSDLKSLTFESQEQVEKFAQENKQWLHADGYGAFFLFTEKVDGEEKFFVACVFFCSGGLEVYVHHLSNNSVYHASCALRVVVPAKKTLDTQS